MKKFDLTTVYNIDRPMSWSAISLFEWNPWQWYKKYVLGEMQIETPEMRFGKMIDEKVQKDKKFLPKLVRLPIQQHKMTTVWNGIPLVGFSDQYRPPFKDLFHGKVVESKNPILMLRDLKTGKLSKPWMQKRADETGQLTMYLFMLYLMDKSIRVADAELFIDWLPTHIKDGQIALVTPVKIHTFQTKRSMTEILKFGQRIQNTWAAMEEYATKQMGSVVHSREEFDK